jgi:hypothetical protein
MAILPNSNLPTDSQPWGRAIETNLKSLESQFAQAEIDNVNRDKSLKTSVDAVSTALVRVKTLADSGHKLYNFAGAVMPTRTPVLTFNKPTWAKSATIVATATVDASVIGEINILSGFIRLFIDGEQVTYTLYDFASSSPTPYTEVNQKYLVITSVVSDSAMFQTLSVNHSGSQNVTGDTLTIWPSFANTASNEIPPLAGDDPWWDLESTFDPGFTNRQVWDVGIDANSSCSVEIVATVFWNADPV